MEIPKKEELELFFTNTQSIYSSKIHPPQTQTYKMQLDKIRQGNSHTYDLRQTVLLNNFQINLFQNLGKIL